MTQASRFMQRALCAGLLASGAALANDFEMADLSIEELANIQITSVSRRPEALAEAAASVFVITADDLRRAGVRSLPDALRLAPNLSVAQVNGGGYAISARGLNGSNNSAPNKMQVLIDGRSVYSPLFSGVFWDVQEVLIEDIARIEVISGPGGTLWGVNAVNGVINVMTRSADATQGSLLAATIGQRGSEVALRYGGAQGNLRWRVFGKHVDERHTQLAGGAAINDARRQDQVGWRADWQHGRDTLSVLADAYRGVGGQPEPGLLTASGLAPRLQDIDTAGVHLGVNWRHQLDGGGSLSWLGSIERNLRDAPPTFKEAINIADLQFLHTLPQRAGHQLVWGAQLRQTWDRVENSDIVAFMPSDASQRWVSVFAQDELALSGSVALTAGARAEHNPYTGTEWLPTLRLAWHAAPGQFVWAGASRTVRAPSRLDVDAFVPGQPPFILRGGRGVRAEEARVLELGYRGQPVHGVALALTAFHNWYDDLRTQELDASGSFVTFASGMQGKARGLEMWGSWQARAHWRLSAGMTALHQAFRLKPGSTDAEGPASARKDPRFTAQLRSTWEVTDGQQFEAAVRRVGRLDSPAVPAYTALDASYLWTLQPGVELALSGQNLNGGHAEYGLAQYRTEAQRALALRLVWRR